MWHSFRLFLRGFLKRFWQWLPILALDVFDLWDRYVVPQWPEVGPMPNGVMTALIVLAVLWTAFLTYHELRSSHAKVGKSARMDHPSLDQVHTWKKFVHGYELGSDGPLNRLNLVYEPEYVEMRPHLSEDTRKRTDGIIGMTLKLSLTDTARDLKRFILRDLAVVERRLKDDEREDQTTVELEEEGPYIEATLTKSGKSYVLEVRNLGETGVFHASMDLSSDDHYMWRGNHRLWWTRANGLEAKIPNGALDYIHLADVEMASVGSQTSYNIDLFHFDDGFRRKLSFGRVGYVSGGQSLEVKGVAHVTISTEPKARGGAWKDVLHFSAKGMDSERQQKELTDTIKDLTQSKSDTEAPPHPESEGEDRET